MKLNGLFILALLSFSACHWFSKGEGDERVLARVNDKYLYAGDLYAVIPKGTPGADSAAMAKNYIDNWIREMVVLSQAEDNLTAEQKGVDLQVEQYRNSLLIYNYERKLIQQKLDTAVSEAEAEEFFKKNTNNFKLLDYEVKLFYLKADAGKLNSAEIFRLMKSEATRDVESLRTLSTTKAIEYSFNDQVWFSGNDLSLKIPVPLNRRAEVFQKGKTSLVSDGNFDYFLYVLNAYSPGEIPSIEIVADDLKQRIVNRRRVELIDQMRTDLLNDALNNKNAETFN